jgi:hypothetical protein
LGVAASETTPWVVAATLGSWWVADHPNGKTNKEKH